MSAKRIRVLRGFSYVVDAATLHAEASWSTLWMLRRFGVVDAVDAARFGVVNETLRRCDASAWSSWIIFLDKREL